MTEWREVPDFPGYLVSEDGQVKSVRRKNVLRDRLIGRTLGTRGYLIATLRRDGQDHKRSVHSLVAEAFIGPRPKGQDVRHLDGNPLNNDVQNLKYGTRSENIQDAVTHGTHHQSSKTHCKKSHEYTPESTYTSPDNQTRRICRVCQADQQRARNARRKMES